VGVHYLKFVLVIGTLGTLIGGIGGRLLGGGLVDLYTQFFRFPTLRFTMDYSALGWRCSSVSGPRCWACSRWCGRR
jgi:putative ABC transport system permease protein